MNLHVLLAVTINLVFGYNGVVKHCCAKVSSNNRITARRNGRAPYTGS